MKFLYITSIIFSSILLSSQESSMKMPTFDLDAILSEDQSRDSNAPIRYAFDFDVDINLFENASVENLDNGDKIWRLRVESDEAIGMKLYFNEFYLPKGSSLLIYNSDYDMVVGPLTFADNHEDQQFSHRLIKGDFLTLEYHEPYEVFDSALINISKVYHAYKDILGFYESSDRDRNCGENVVCDDGEFEDQINSVIFLDMGGYICSASLINNTSFDLTPYVLTANHCIDTNLNDSNPAPTGVHNYYTFYFNHQSSSCSNSNGYYNNSRTGSTVRASYYYSDVALLEMDYSPASSFNAYYAGWSKSTSTPQISAGIHHPGGDPKKINYDNNQYASSDGWYSSNTHWRLSWAEGGTEGGSSGSPVFNDDKLIVGQLHGGSGECGSGTDYYGKFSKSWIGGGTSSSRLSDWLDPEGTGLTSIPGTYNGEGGGEAPEITLISPNGGESLDLGTNYEITWDDNFSDNVSLKLYRGGVFAATISSSTESDGSFNWTIPTDLQENDNYKIKIQNVSESVINDLSDNNFSITSPGIIYLSIDSVSLTGSEGTIDIYMENNTSVSGYQFVINDSPDVINITGVQDLSDSDFSLSSSEGGQILAFSFTGGVIQPSSGLLLYATFEVVDNQETTLCIQDAVFSDPSADPLIVNIGDCVTFEMANILMGDINFDGILNVLDAVLLVNAVLDPGLLNDAEFQAADFNTDGLLNVLDVVSLINIILTP